MATVIPVLPGGYHLANFVRILNHAETLYADLLLPTESQLITAFRDLPEFSQSLLVRLLTRKGTLFRSDRLRYADVPDLGAALPPLVNAAMIEVLVKPDFRTALPLLTVADLQSLALGRPQGQQRRADWIELVEREQGQRSTEPLDLPCELISVAAATQDWFERLKLCFFANGYQDLTEFVLRDLGLTQYPAYDLDQSNRFFNSRVEMDWQLSLQQWQQALETPELLTDSEALLLLQQVLGHAPDHPVLRRRTERLSIQIARQLERLDEGMAAMAIYTECETSPAPERLLRLQLRHTAPEVAWETCAHILLHPSAPTDYEYARRIAAGKLHQHATADVPESLLRPLQSPVTASVSLALPADGFASVETLAAKAIAQERGGDCFYVENSVWRSLFGLLCWDIIYAPIVGAFVNPFQSAPLDLASPDFYRRRQPAFATRLTPDEGTDSQWQQLIWHHWHTHLGATNAFVSWELMTEAFLSRILTSIPVPHLFAVLRRIARQPALHGNGLPDLLWLGASSYELMEVKAPGDRLQPNQKVWFDYFSQHNIPACVLAISWH